MAGEISHIVLTTKVYDDFFEKFDRGAFVVGTIFADIRHYAGLPRDSTHRHGLNLHDVMVESNSFRAGLMFHSLVDDLRIDYMKQHYPQAAMTQVAHFAQKLMEDQIMYPHLVKWDEIVTMLDTIHPEELEFGANRTDVKKWHLVMQDYFMEAPTVETRHRFIEARSHAPEARLAREIARMQASRQLTHLVKQFYVQFDGLLTSYNLPAKVPHRSYIHSPA